MDPARSSRLVFLAAMTALAALSQASGGAQPVATERRSEMPFELPFAHDSLVGAQQVAVSPDGRYAGYVVDIAPSLSGGAADNAHRLIVTEVKTGQHRTLNPQDANCFWPSTAPNSQRLVFYCEEEGVRQLWLHDFSQQTTRRLGISSEYQFDEPAQPPVWSADGQEVIVPVVKTVSRAERSAIAEGENSKPDAEVQVYRSGWERLADASADQDWARPATPAHRAPVRDLFFARIDASRGELLSIVPAGFHSTRLSFSVSSGGRWLAQQSNLRRELEYPWRMVTDLAVRSLAGASSQTISLGKMSFLSERPSLWHPKREQLLWARDGGLWTADLSSEPVVPRRLAPTLSTVAEPLAITRDGSQLIVGAYSRDRSPYTSRVSLTVMTVPLAGGEPHELALPAGQAFVQLITQRNGVAWQRSPNTIGILIHRIDDGHRGLVEINLDSGRVTPLWQGRAVVDFVSASADSAALFGVYEDMNTPPDLYRFSADLSSRTRLSQVEPRFSDLRLAQAHTFQASVPQYDGSRTQVTAAILLPPGAQRGDALPTVAIVYPRTTHIDEAARFGGGWPASIPASLLTSRGYAVLLTTVGAFPESTPGHLSVDLTDAVLAQVQAAASLGYTDASRVAVAGLSFGAYSAALLTSQTHFFRAGICIAGVYDLTYSATAHPGFLSNTDLGIPPALQFWYGLGEHPWSDLTRVLQNSPFFQADRIQTPLLILHTVEDGTPVEDARKMFNALRLLGRTAQYAEYSGGGHGLAGWSRQAAVDGSRRILAFLETHVRPPGRTTPQAFLRPSP